MITKGDIQHLADLARIKVSEVELEHLTGEIDSILGYVGQVTQVGGEMEREVPELRNVMRDDVVTNAPGEYTEAILTNAPARDGNYLKVKKILGGSSDDII